MERSVAREAGLYTIPSCGCEASWCWNGSTKLNLSAITSWIDRPVTGSQDAGLFVSTASCDILARVDPQLRFDDKTLNSSEVRASAILSKTCLSGFPLLPWSLSQRPESSPYSREAVL
jgi:hypothetical protein